MIDLDNRTSDELLVYMFHPKLLPTFKKFREQIDFYLKPELSAQGMIILDSLDGLDAGLTSKGVIHHLRNYGFSPETAKLYSKRLSTIEGLGPEDFNAVHDRIKGFLLKRMLNFKIAEYQDKRDAKKLMDQMKVMQTSGLLNSFMDEKSYSIASFSSLDPEALNQEVKERVIKSSLDIVNRSTPLGGYMRNQMVCISASPGSGKSLLAMRECLAFANPEYQGTDPDKEGIHVLYSAFGDLRQYDFMSRMCAQITHRPFGYVEMNLKQSFEETLRKTSRFEIAGGQRVGYNELESLVTQGKVSMNDARMIPGSTYMKNITIETYLPDKFSAQEYLAHLQSDEYMNTGKSIHDWADVIVIDYDANIRSEEQMYLKGEEIYQTLYQLTFPDKLIIMISQLAKAAWSEEIIGLGSLNESSRKQMIIDTMITLSHPPSTNPANHIGWMNLCKNRRGALMKCPYFRDLDGDFYELKKDHYELIKAASDTKTFIPDVHLFSEYIPGEISIMEKPETAAGYGSMTPQESAALDEAVWLEELENTDEKKEKSN